MWFQDYTKVLSFNQILQECIHLLVMTFLEECNRIQVKVETITERVEILYTWKANTLKLQVNRLRFDIYH